MLTGFSYTLYIIICMLLLFFCQEALWREEAVKKKLAALQESTTNLMNSSCKIWTVRLSISMHGLSSMCFTVTLSKYHISCFIRSCCFFGSLVDITLKMSFVTVERTQQQCMAAAASGRPMQSVVWSFLLPL